MAAIDPRVDEADLDAQPCPIETGNGPGVLHFIDDHGAVQEQAEATFRPDPAYPTDACHLLRGLAAHADEQSVRNRIEAPEHLGALSLNGGLHGPLASPHGCAVGLHFLA